MGHRLKCIIVKHHTCDHNKEHEDEEDVVVESRIATPHGEHKVKFDLPYEQTANALMSAKGYSEYVKKHGYHFTDAAYLANMYYADLYPDPLKDEASCLRAAYKVANDPDGYEGMIFCRWTADAIGKAIKLDWEKFV